MPVLVDLLDVVFKALSTLIFVRILLSWAPVLGLHHPAVRSADRAVKQLTAPILDPIRNVMPPVGGFDLSPIVAILLLALVHGALRAVLISLVL